MSDDIFTKLDKAEVEFKQGHTGAWMRCIATIRKTGIRVDVHDNAVWVINGCIMWKPLDE